MICSTVICRAQALGLGLPCCVGALIALNLEESGQWEGMYKTRFLVHRPL